MNTVEPLKTESPYRHLSAERDPAARTFEVRMHRQRAQPGYRPCFSIDLLRENPRFRTRLARSGRPIHVWTVNTEEELRLCEELGAAVVISDRPAYMLQLLGA